MSRVLFGLIMIAVSSWSVISSLKHGELLNKNWSGETLARRSEDPGHFWLNIGFWTLFGLCGVGTAIYGIVEMLN